MNTDSVGIVVVHVTTQLLWIGWSEYWCITIVASSPGFPAFSVAAEKAGKPGDKAITIVRGIAVMFLYT